MQDISGFGVRVRVVASATFPEGFTVSQLADDTDPFDIPAQAIAEGAMGVNGDMVVWSVANPLNVTLAVIPGSDDDRNLAAVFESNRVGRGKSSSRDNITLVGTYPDGSSVTLSTGKMVNGLPGQSIASSGRMKSKPYNFIFEGMSKT